MHALYICYPRTYAYHGLPSCRLPINHLWKPYVAMAYVSFDLRHFDTLHKVNFNKWYKISSCTYIVLIDGSMLIDYLKNLQKIEVLMKVLSLKDSLQWWLKFLMTLCYKDSMNCQFIILEVRVLTPIDAVLFLSNDIIAIRICIQCSWLKYF